MPYLSSALLVRKNMNAYGYGCPLMIDPDERIVHKKLQFKIKKSGLIKPDVFRRLLMARKEALREFKEKGKDALLAEMEEPQPKEDDPEVIRKQVLENIDKEERKHKKLREESRDHLERAKGKREGAVRQVEAMERELKMLHAKRKNLVVDLKSASKQVKSMVTQQKSMVSQLTSPSSGSFGGLLNKSPGTHPGPSSGNEIEEGEVKAPLTLSTNGHPNLSQQDSRRKQSSQWGNPLPLRWGSS